MSSSAKRKGGRKLKPGLVLQDRYRIEEPIAEGGMASVYRGTDVVTGREVAIKCLYEIYNDNEIVQARFIDEGRIQMLLKHPNILRVFELVEQPVLAFVMEYVRGGSLEDMLQQRGPIPQDQILEFIIPVLSALGMAHSKGIIHRDLKPSNILMEELGMGRYRPKVMDFGVAKVSRDRSLTATGTTVGTLHYMSPEQIVGSKRIDGRADIYSMGITLYKLATGEVPFNASTEFALMMAQVEAAPTPPRRLRPDNVTPELERVILKALQKKPHDRYQSIRAFTEALVDISQSHYGGATVTTQVPEHLLSYALMADVVAEDRTREIMRSTFSDVLQEDPDGEHAQTNELLPPTMLDGDLEDADSGSTVVIERPNMERLRQQDRQSLPPAEDPTMEVSMDAALRHEFLSAPQTLLGEDPFVEDPTTVVTRPGTFGEVAFGAEPVDSKESTLPRGLGPPAAARPSRERQITQPARPSAYEQAARGPLKQSTDRELLDRPTQPIPAQLNDQLRSPAALGAAKLAATSGASNARPQASHQASPQLHLQTPAQAHASGWSGVTFPDATQSADQLDAKRGSKGRTLAVILALLALLGVAGALLLTS